MVCIELYCPTSRARPRKSNPGYHRQTGGALIVAMMLMFMMSLMGVASMRAATIEKRMSTNAVHSYSTMQIAESATELTLGNTNNLEQALRSGVNNTVVTDVSSLTNAAVETDAELTYTGKGPPIGTSLGVNSGFAAIRYTSSGRSAIPSVAAESIVVQGAYRVVPSL